MSSDKANMKSLYIITITALIALIIHTGSSFSKETACQKLKTDFEQVLAELEETRIKRRQTYIKYLDADAKVARAVADYNAHQENSSKQEKDKALQASSSATLHYDVSVKNFTQTYDLAARQAKQMKDTLDKIKTHNCYQMIGWVSTKQCKTIVQDMSQAYGKLSQAFQNNSKHMTSYFRARHDLYLLKIFFHKESYAINNAFTTHKRLSETTALSASAFKERHDALTNIQGLKQNSDSLCKKD